MRNNFRVNRSSLRTPNSTLRTCRGGNYETDNDGSDGDRCHGQGCVATPRRPKKDGKPDGGSLSYGEYGRPATLDPITSNEMISLRITELIFNGLVGINEKQELVPELAERWESSKDGRTYTFFLRKDVTWHPKRG